LNDDLSSIDLLGPLSGNNSAFSYIGSGLSKNATQLLYNFSGGSAYLLFEKGLGGGTSFFRLQANAAGFNSGESVQVLGPVQSVFMGGNQVIATSFGVPEPSTFGLLGLGAAALMLRSKRSVRF
jgi:hypothetical protein